jgi:hypothetical protein
MTCEQCYVKSAVCFIPRTEETEGRSRMNTSRSPIPPDPCTAPPPIPHPEYLALRRLKEGRCGMSVCLSIYLSDILIPDDNCIHDKMPHDTRKRSREGGRDALCPVSILILDTIRQDKMGLHSQIRSWINMQYTVPLLCVTPGLS